MKAHLSKIVLLICSLLWAVPAHSLDATSFNPTAVEVTAKAALHSRALRCTTLPATKFLHGCPCRSCARHSANLQGVPHETTDRRLATGTHRPAFAGRFPALKKAGPVSASI